MHTHSDLPDLLAGPLVRRVDPERILLWLVASRPLQMSATLQPHEQASRQLRPDNTRIIPIGRHAYVHLLTLSPDSPLPQDQIIHYDLHWQGEQGSGLQQSAPHLCHGDELPSLMIASDNRRLLESNQMLSSEVDVLKTDNARLRENKENEFFLNGAFAVLIGVMIALIVPRMMPKRRSEWG